MAPGLHLRTSKESNGGERGLEIKETEDPRDSEWKGQEARVRRHRVEGGRPLWASAKLYFLARVEVMGYPPYNNQKIIQ